MKQCIYDPRGKTKQIVWKELLADLWHQGSERLNALFPVTERRAEGSARWVEGEGLRVREGVATRSRSEMRRGEVGMAL